MLTKTFREAMRRALAREAGSAVPEEIISRLDRISTPGDARGATMVALLPVCRVIEYNEATPEEKRSREDVAALIAARDCRELEKDHPTLYAVLYPSGTKGFENADYHLYVRYFKEAELDGRSIARIGMGLHMTAEEINGVLLTYGKNTISWYRVDDLLFRYALKKRWTYGRFEQVYGNYLVYRAGMEGGKQPAIPMYPGMRVPKTEQKRRDSACMTRYNMRALDKMLNTPDCGDDVLYKKLHALFIDTEQTANGAPRRALAKICRWPHGNFSADYAWKLLKLAPGEKTGFGECTALKASAAWQMLLEAAGRAPEALPEDEACDRVNGVLSLLDDLCTGFKTAAHPPLPHGIDFYGGRDYVRELDQWRLSMLLRPENAENRQTLQLVAETLYRDLPQEYQAYDGISAPDGDSRLPDAERLVKAAGIALNRVDGRSHSWFFESALRRGVFHLLVCCNSLRGRKLLSATVYRSLLLLGWRPWNGIVSKKGTYALIEKLVQLPTAPEEDLTGCPWSTHREIKNLFSEYLTQEKYLQAYRRFRLLFPADRERLMHEYLDIKCREALQMLRYSADQRETFMAQWVQLDLSAKDYCLTNNLRRQYLTERDVADPVSFALSSVRQQVSNDKKKAPMYIELGKRSGEPGRNLILFMALVMFGYVAERDARSFTRESCERYISESIRSAWGTSWQLSAEDGALDGAVEALIGDTVDRFRDLRAQRPDVPLSSLWLTALAAACQEYRNRCREEETLAMAEYNRTRDRRSELLDTRNALFSSTLMASQWKYGREKRKAARHP